MMWIHGKVLSTSLEEDDKQIVFVLNDGTKHKYLYQNNKIFFIIQEPNTSEPTEYETLKYITLCEELDTCTFLYENNKLTTTVKIGEFVYKDNFSI